MHGFCGAYGVLCTGLFARKEYRQTGSRRRWRKRERRYFRRLESRVRISIGPKSITSSWQM